MFQIRDLLKIEGDPEILKFKIPELDIPIWLYLRFDLFWYIQRKEIGLEDPHVKVNPYKLPLNLKIKYITYTLRYHPFKGGNNKILIFGPSIANVLENGKYYNRLYDPIIELFGEDVRLIESSDKFIYYYPKHINKFYFSDIITITSALLSKFGMYYRKFNISFRDYESNLYSFIDYVEKKCEKLFGISLKDYFKNKLSKLIRMPYKLKIRNFMFRKLLELVKPKLVIINDAHNDGNSDLINLCKRLGIRVAEFQHGYIGQNHLVYNWSDNIREYITDFLPDFMLFWGEYWANNSNIPGLKKVIGFPYLEKKLKEQSTKNKDIFILLVSGGSIPNEYVKIGKVIKERYKDKKLVFRPHPSERPEVNLRYKELLKNGWELDNNDLYSSLSKSYICISLEMTTVLFESTIFCKKVFLIKSNASLPYIDHSFPIPVIDNYKQLFEYVDNDYIEQVDFEKIKSKLFNLNWEKNFKQFLIDIGVSL